MKYHEKLIIYTTELTGISWKSNIFLVKVSVKISVFVKNRCMCLRYLLVNVVKYHGYI